jgi:hypothetical protein
MANRGAPEIREEIAAERQRLDDDLTNLERELLSSVPLLAGGILVAAAVVLGRSRRKRKTPKSITFTWKLK